MYDASEEQTNFSGLEDEWLTKDYKKDDVSRIVDRTIRSFDGFDKRWYYLDRNENPIIPGEE